MSDEPHLYDKIRWYENNLIKECWHPDGHIWVTVDNAITENGLEVYAEAKCEFCNQERLSGVKP